MKVVRVDIYEEFIFTFIEEEQKPNISVVDYILPKNKRQSRMNKTYNSRHLLRVL